jgi:hypothetical protein
MALTGQVTGDTSLVTAALAANLAALAVAVAGLREAQQHAAQAAAARATASHLHAWAPARSPMRPGRAEDRQRRRIQTTAYVARGDFPAQPGPGRPATAAPGRTLLRSGRGPLPPRQAGPSR